MSLWCRYGARMSALWDSCGALTKTRKLQKNLQMASRLQVYICAHMHLSTQCAAYASAFLATSARSAKVASSS